jgi:hypothetical protein
VGLGLLHGFVTVYFAYVRSLALYPTSNMEDQGLHLAGTYPWTCLKRVAVPGTLAPARIALRVIGVRKPPLHGNVVVLEAATSHLLLFNLCIRANVVKRTSNQRN